MACQHPNKEVSGQRKEKGQHGVERVIRSYSCPDCGEAWSDLSPKKEETMSKDQKKPGKKPEGKKPATTAAKQTAPKTKPKETTEVSARTLSALADKRFKLGTKYEQSFTARHGKNKGKVVTCKLEARADGFYDQDGVKWETPTALTCNFAHKYLGQNEKSRRPAAHFFSAYRLWTPPKDGKTAAKKAAAKPAKKANKPPAPKATKPPAKKAAKPAAAPAPAPAPAPTSETNDDLAPPDLD